MANAVVEIWLPGYQDLTLSLELYPLGSDTIAATIATLTQATARKSLYTGVTAAGLTGIHTAHAKEGSTLRGGGYVLMDDTTSIHRVVSHPALAKIDGAEVKVSDTQLFYTVLTESYRAAGAEGTLAQFLYELRAHMGEAGIVGLLKTLRKLDGVTPSGKTFTLNAIPPTDVTETT